MNKQPTQTLRDGSISATIWHNVHEERDFYSVDIVRNYKDNNEKWQSNSSFTGSELLRVSLLAQRAYTAIAEIKAEKKG